MIMQWRDTRNLRSVSSSPTHKKERGEGEPDTKVLLLLLFIYFLVCVCVGGGRADHSVIVDTISVTGWENLATGFKTGYRQSCHES